MRKLSKACLILGCLLITGSLALFLLMYIGNTRAQTQNAETVQLLQSLLPAPKPGITDTYSNMSMPVLEIDGEDYIGLLDIPSLGLTLPVGNTWDKGTVRRHPCRLDGTAYDGSLLIGGIDQPGQLDGFERIQQGSEVSVTDLTGSVFSYEIERIDRASSASLAVLTAGEYDLTLFVRNAYGLEYILLRCMLR